MYYNSEITRALDVCYAAFQDDLPGFFELASVVNHLQNDTEIVTALLYGAARKGVPYADIQNPFHREAVRRPLWLLLQYDADPEKEQILLEDPVSFNVKHAWLLHYGTPGRPIRDDENATIKDYWDRRFRLERTFDVPFLMHSKAEVSAEKRLRNARHSDRILGCLMGALLGDAREGTPTSNTQQMLFTATASLSYWTRKQTVGVSATEEDFLFRSLQEWNGHNQYPESVSWLSGIPELREYTKPADLDLMGFLNRGEKGSLHYPGSSNDRASALCRVPGLVAHHKHSAVKDVMLLASRAAAITHGETAALCNALFAHLLHRTLFGGSTTGEGINLYLKEAKWLLFECFGCTAPLKALFEKINHAVLFGHNGEDDEPNMRLLGSGYRAMDAICAAIYCVLRYPLSIRDALQAANCSENRTAVGFLVGALMSAKFGYQYLVAKHDLPVIPHTSLITEIAGDLIGENQLDRDSTPEDDPIWWEKYVTCTYKNNG